MLDALFRAPIAGAQLPSKITECFGGCGAMVTYRTNSRVYCSSCKIKNKRESARRAAERQRRKKGIPQVKGAILVCEECESDFVSSSGGRVKWCPDCRPVMALKRARDYSYELDKSGTRQRVGDTKECANCLAPFTVTVKGRRIYCDDCMVLQKAGSLPSLLESKRRWRRKRYSEDPKFALNAFMRGGILKSLGDKKDGNSWTAFVDYTVDELKDHLERQFLPGMTWDNRGINGWHIDHILPISSFDYDSPDHPDFKACWALTNLRPMWGGDNIRKKDKRLFLI